MLRTLARVSLGIVFTVALASMAFAANGITHVTGTLKTPSGAPAVGVWVCLQTCPAATQTDAGGNWSVDVYTGSSGIQYLFVYMDGGDHGVGGTQLGYQGPTLIMGDTQSLGSYSLSATPSGGGGGGGGGSCPTSAAAHSGTPTQTVYLPNITKTFGGPSGWYTPFIVQNTGTVNTDLEVSFYKFADGSLAYRNIVTALKPSSSYADVPNNDCYLTDWTQYSVVVKSFGANIVAVVNQHQGSSTKAEADTYVGASSGSANVFLPNVVRNFFGFHSPVIIQNLGSASTVATASFVSFDGTKTATIQRTIAPGQSQYIEPNAESSLTDGTQYAVTVSASQPISVVVNTHRDSGVTTPTMYSVNGNASGSGAPVLYGPYAVKNVPGVGKGISTIVVQNMGTGTVSPTLTFTPLGGGTSTTITGPATGPNKSWAFDPRYTSGDTTKAKCGANASAGCLADGEYSFVANAAGSIAAQVNIIWETSGGEPQSAAGYTAISKIAPKVFLPNVTRRLGGASGWTTPFYVQSAGATNVTVSWYRFSDGALVTTQSLSLSQNMMQRIDPTVPTGLSDDTQYSVVLDGNGGNLAAIVSEINLQGGDGAMTYEGFAP